MGRPRWGGDGEGRRDGEDVISGGSVHDNGSPDRPQFPLRRDSPPAPPPARLPAVSQPALKSKSRDSDNDVAARQTTLTQHSEELETRHLTFVCCEKIKIKQKHPFPRLPEDN